MSYLLKMCFCMLTWTFSRQIRPPIYSMKQSKLRRRRVVRYAILYFVMLVVFLALIVGPAVAGKMIPASLSKDISSKLPFPLAQPAGQDIDDTKNHTQTGTGRVGYSGPGLASMTTTAASSTETDSSDDSKKFRFV